MAFPTSADALRRLVNRTRERLWVKPLVVCLMSIAGVFVAKFADGTGLRKVVPTITPDSIDTVLSVMAASMLVIATFAVASMVSAFASASSTATPRAFTLVVADDVSQNALSTFIGAFIFSVVALTATKNDYFGPAGLFTIFALTVFVFATVIVTFIRWVDRIARLGRMDSTIDKVEHATADAMRRRRNLPTLRGTRSSGAPEGQPVYSPAVGYVRHVDTARLQECAEEAGVRVIVAALPGTFAAPGQPLAYVTGGGALEPAQVVAAFGIGGTRQFDDDPRFGLVVLSEIAGRALSPGINDPGTAIDVIGTLVRLFVLWREPLAADREIPPPFDRVAVPELDVRDMFDDAFTAIGRDGAGSIEVALRLQKALRSLSIAGDAPMREAAAHHGRLALARSEKALELDDDVALVRGAAGFARGDA